jgi:hypothetical protein
MARTKRLTESQRHALLLAYSSRHELYDYGDDFNGVSQSTLRSLVRKGSLEFEDPDDPEGELLLTRQGRAALGLQGAIMRKPKRMSTAVRRALEHLLGGDANIKKPEAVFLPKHIPAALWVNDEQCADFSDALMLVDVDEAGLEGFEDVEWAAVAQMVTELGFPCYAEQTRHIQAFWPDDE